MTAKGKALIGPFWKYTTIADELELAYGSLKVTGLSTCMGPRHAPQ
jgi:hypothetical protein